MIFGKKTLAIVGGGSIATSVLRQLLDEIMKSDKRCITDVIVFDPNNKVGAGMAYQLDSPSNLLNTRAGTMSPIDDEPDHFVKWLKANPAKWESHFPKIHISEAAFLPRGLFGLYLDDLFLESVERLNSMDVSVQHVEIEIRGMRPTAAGYELQAGSLSYFADAVVLAIGNLHSGEWDHLVQESGYFNSPYPCTDLVNTISPTETVCILGTGLSAIDAVVSLADSGHRGKLIMASRGGRLPSVRGIHNSNYSPGKLSRDAIKDLLHSGNQSFSLTQLYTLLMEEIVAADGLPFDIDSILRPQTGPHRYLDIEVQDATSSNRAWQSVLYGLNESIDLIWHHLNDADKARFEKGFKSQWLAYRVSFPVDNALKLQELIHCDQLSVFGGTKRSWRDEASNSFATSIDDHRLGFRATLYSDSLVNGTGFTADAAKCKSKLVRQILDSGLAAPHPYGGIVVDFHSNELRTQAGTLLPNVYAVGALTAGTHFWTNAMNVNARLAHQVVKNLTQRADREPRSSFLTRLPQAA
ncbi:FAD/NAD(P)-binding protein [Pollutimonas bauzanensis]|uniref:Uncharacterized NAD(P)/FAD-binding protein YdhS n=1 Tax=Pollutimonas bauzanensis TaxID=658167 RepID=A0A1M5MRG8_9BURK|nr:FAD/NAD(P)-binding protein [Pollutimonas bauzanensis]SHG79796.1 Uncharacterized NAD(P)/FAD-binding protein YdhS [Pollutimonas bauzanensis]